MSWLSASIANQKECLEGLELTRGDLRQKVEAAIVNSRGQTSNSLEVAAGIMGGQRQKTSDVGLFSESASTMQRMFKLGANLIVAKDGSGHVGSIQEAVNLVVDESLGPTFIYVKEGIYEENVVVEETKWNVYMIGDGMYSSIITGNRSSTDPEGYITSWTATLFVSGQGFVAIDMGFRNTAGPEHFQAVAAFSSSDRSIFFRCSFDAYQDTLYAHSNRQFYRDCDIIGTIDFIFGDAAAVFQRCNILPREPLPFQYNTITAQGKEQPAENTGFSIHECIIRPYEVVTRPTYLSRPWRNYSTVVVMKTEMSSVVDPAGWVPWEGSVPPDTINFAEIENTGPGADISGRVSWPGCRPAISEAEASMYTVGAFINGAEWIPLAGVPFDPNF
ncbi:pectinesterase 3-like [Phalaenopsis equestris]|uniref:pectinesterase 3-like n=1 Tax=Phalaenopsis equestris TaxID=78828 RepID=UPI0009E229C1|nr:pectinesterase 3-like [Phalaenopsis equestris]